MSIVTFYGIITPRSAYLLNLHGENLVYASPHLSFRFDYRIVDSIITVECEIAEASEKTINMAYMVVYAHVRGVADAVAFSKGIGLGLLIEEAQISGRERTWVRHGSPALEGLCPLEVGEIINIVMVDRRSLKPLNDLVETLFHPWDAAMDCYRAIEGICHLLSGDPDKGVRWQTLRENLHVSQDYINFIRDRSHAGRHGQAGRVNLSDVDKIQRRSWRIMTRFLEFRKRKNVNLSEPEFR